MTDATSFKGPFQACNSTRAIFEACHATMPSLFPLLRDLQFPFLILLRHHYTAFNIAFLQGSAAASSTLADTFFEMKVGSPSSALLKRLITSLKDSLEARFCIASNWGSGRFSHSSKLTQACVPLQTNDCEMPKFCAGQETVLWVFGHMHGILMVQGRVHLFCQQCERLDCHPGAFQNNIVPGRVFGCWTASKIRLQLLALQPGNLFRLLSWQHEPLAFEVVCL